MLLQGLPALTSLAAVQALPVIQLINYLNFYLGQNHAIDANFRVPTLLQAIGVEWLY